MNSSNSAPQKFTVIIPAAGRGSRMAAEIPKQYIKIHGKTMLAHTVRVFQLLEACERIIICIGAGDANMLQNALPDMTKIKTVLGGKERKDSIYNALTSMQNPKDNELILVHDAARPCVNPDDINALLNAMSTARAATLASPVSNTLRKGESDGELIAAGDIVSRENLYNFYTPQAFHYKDIMQAHKSSNKDHTATDDSQLVSSLGIDVAIINSSPKNIKITMPEDLELANIYLKTETETRIGQGFDVHAFDTTKKGPVRLCGIDIEHNYALKGHSDADVGLHTLTDAIYGSIGAGDIGIHFPPSNNDFKDMDSAIFLKHAVELLHAKGGTLINADITLICEAPKLAPHNQAMKERVAEICGVHSDRINIKATTTEKLGFTGRKEGIAAQASVSVSLPVSDD